MGDTETQRNRKKEKCRMAIRFAIRGFSLSTPPQKKGVEWMFFRAVAVSSPRRGGRFVAHRVSGGYAGARINQPRSGAKLRGRGGLLSPLSGLNGLRSGVPTAYAVGYKSAAPYGAKKQQGQREGAATDPRNTFSTLLFCGALFSPSDSLSLCVSVSHFCPEKTQWHVRPESMASRQSVQQLTCQSGLPILPNPRVNNSEQFSGHLEKSGHGQPRTYENASGKNPEFL